MIIWLQFIVSSALVITGGFLLAKNGKELGERYGLSDLWVGFIFLAAITSIPELATAIGAVWIADSPSLALSDVLGSNAFNIFILAPITICLSRPAIASILSLSKFRVMILMILSMTGLVMIFAALNQDGNLFSPGKISLASWAIVFIYLAGSWKLFRDEHPSGRDRDEAVENSSGQSAGPNLYPRLILSIILVIAGGFWLARTGREIAEITHWGENFVGALFLALVTSLPEMSVCLALIRMNTYDMALGNILGSNIFNLGIIFWADLVYRRGSILSGVTPPFYIIGGLGIILLLVLAAALMIPSDRKLKRRIFTWDSITIIALYLAGMYWLFRLSYNLTPAA
jgi:cation:H+ antiporter